MWVERTPRRPVVGRSRGGGGCAAHGESMSLGTCPLAHVLKDMPLKPDRSGHVLEHHGDALAAADAGGADGEAGVAALELVGEVGGDAGPGRAERVAEGDRAAVD